MLHLDTNVILRYLLQDCEQFIAQSKEYMENSKTYIRNEVFAEVVYVLNKTYQIPRNELANILKELLSMKTIEVDSKEVIILALEIFETKNIDFVDSLLCAYSKLLKVNVVSFDKKLNKCLDETNQ
jgi:predicted nucleic-acid-binding protein